MSSAADAAVLMQFVAILASTPWLVVLMIGGIVCLRRLSAHPRESWLVLAAIAVSLLARFGIPTLVALSQLSGVFTNPRQDAWIWSLFSDFPSAVLQSAAWILLIYAAFGKGRTTRSKYLVEDDADQTD